MLHCVNHPQLVILYKADLDDLDLTTVHGVEGSVTTDVHGNKKCKD